MSVATWLDMAKADAARRGLEPVVPLLDGLGASMASLRAAATRRRRRRTPTIRSASALRSRTACDSSRAELRGLAHIAADLRAGRLTSERLVEDCLAKIAELQPH